MADVHRRNTLVISIAQILTWAKTDGPASSEAQVHEQVTKVKALWLSFQAEHLKIVNLCGPTKIAFHTDVEKNAEDLYMETLQRLRDFLKCHMDAVWAEAFNTLENVTDNKTVVNTTLKILADTVSTKVNSMSASIATQSIQQSSCTTDNLEQQRERIQRHVLHKLGIRRLYDRCAHTHNSSLATLQTYMDTLDEHWHGYMNHINDSYIGTDINADITETETEYMDTKAIIRELISNTASTVNATPPAIMGAHLKLPPIQIGKFNGDFGNWIAFHDSFTKMVELNTNLSMAQKLYYLKQCVEGDAEKLISPYEISDANYLKAWNALKARYDNKRKIANSTLKSLFGLSKMEKESGPAIRAQLDTFLDAVYQLHSLGMPTHHWDDILVFTLAEKLDSITRGHWELSLKDNELPTWRQLRTFLETRAKSLQACDTSLSSTSKTYTSDRLQHAATGNHHPSTTSTPLPGTKCPMCSLAHFVFACPEFRKKTTRERYNFAVEHHLCFNCLKGNHSTKKCLSGACRTCNLRHHTLLHYTEQRAATNELPMKMADTEVSNELKTVSHHGTIHHQRNQVLLATAVAKVQLPDGSFQKVRLLFDTGSQSTFITEACVQRLRLTKAKASINISGLGIGHAVRTRGIVHLQLRPHFENNINISLDALVLETISSHIPIKRVCRTGVPHLAKIHLADPNFDIPAEVDILIGSDYYNKFILNDIITGNDCEPTAQNTLLGWVLFGPVISKNTTSNSVVSLQTNLDLDSSPQPWQLKSIRSSLVHPKAEKCFDYIN